MSEIKAKSVNLDEVEGLDDVVNKLHEFGEKNINDMLLKLPQPTDEVDLFKKKIVVMSGLISLYSDYLRQYIGAESTITHLEGCKLMVESGDAKARKKMN